MNLNLFLRLPKYLVCFFFYIKTKKPHKHQPPKLSVTSLFFFGNSPYATSNASPKLLYTNVFIEIIYCLIIIRRDEICMGIVCINPLRLNKE